MFFLRKIFGLLKSTVQNVGKFKKITLNKILILKGHQLIAHCRNVIVPNANK